MKIFILAPHIDDGEVGCGGAMSKFKNEEVYYVAFSLANQSDLEKEVKDAMKVFNIPDERLILMDYPVRRFPFYRQEILEDMIRLNKDLRPDLVFLPSTHDTHQDHQVISQEGFRAFKKTSILGYEEPWNNLSFTTNSFVILDRKNMKDKLDALSCYHSQSNRNIISNASMTGLALTRGTQIGVEYAEAFETIRWMLR